MMTSEPIRLMSLLSAALTSTLSLAAFVGASNELVGGLNVAAGAWLIVAFEVVRRKVDSPQTSAAKDAALSGLTEQTATTETLAPSQLV